MNACARRHPGAPGPRRPTLAAAAGTALTLLLGASTAHADDEEAHVLRLGGEDHAAALEAELALVELRISAADATVPADRAGALGLLEAGAAAVLLARPDAPRLFVSHCGHVDEHPLPPGSDGASALLTAELLVAALDAPCAPPPVPVEGGGALTPPSLRGVAVAGDFLPDDGAFGEAGRTSAPVAPRPAPSAWRGSMTLGPTFDALGARFSGHLDLGLARLVAAEGARAFGIGARVSLPLRAERDGDERTTAEVHLGALDLSLEGRLRRGPWALIGDAGPALFWARIRVDDTPGPMQPNYPLLGARAVFGALSTGISVERDLGAHLGLRLSLRLRHAFPRGVTLRRTPQEGDASPSFFRFGSQVGLRVGLSFR